MANAGRHFKPQHSRTWRTVGVFGALVLWAWQAGVTAHASGASGRGRDPLAWISAPAPTCGEFVLAAEEAAGTVTPGNRTICWVGQLPPTSSLAVADWADRAAVIGVGGLYGP